MIAKHWSWLLRVVFGATVLLHAPPLDNYLDNDDAWNYVLEAERFLDGEGSAHVEGGNYFVHQNLQRLLPSLSWIARFGLFELWMPAWHLPSILLHGLNALLLVLLWRRLGARPEVALLSGLLFGLSPLHAHTVAWIGGTYDLFLGAFLTGTLLAFADGRTRLGLICCAGALMSKESGVMVAPILLLYVLLYERGRGLRSAAQRLWPYAAVCAAILCLRLAQIVAAGSLEQAGLPARTLGLAPLSLVTVGPAALLAGLGDPLRALTVDVPNVLPLVVAGLLLLGLGLRRRALDWTALSLALVSAWLLVVPVLLLREAGVALDTTTILRNPRYLYVSLMMASILPATALLGPGPRYPGPARGLAAVAVLASAVLGVQAVLLMTQFDPVTHVVADKLSHSKQPPGSDMFLLANAHDEAAFRLLMSHWATRRVGARIRLVQRGSWRILERDPASHWGLEFNDGFIHVADERFTAALVSPDRGDSVYLLRQGGPDGGHAVIQVEMPVVRAPRPGRITPIVQDWMPVWSEVPSALTLLGGVTPFFEVGKPPDRNTGFRHGPRIRTAQPLWLRADSIWGFRVRYVCSGEAWKMPERSVYAHGYAELHWRSERVEAVDSYVQFPLVQNGEEHSVEVPLWFDPVWRASGLVEWIGFHPLDAPAKVTLLGIDIIHNR